jgi:hypothetical protein
MYADAAELADFGLTPQKTRTPLTSKEQVAALEKRLATRKARHIMGKRERESIVVNAQAPAEPQPTGTPKAP